MFLFPFSVHHAGDLIALGSKPSGSKPSLRHPASDSDDSAKPSKSSSTLNIAGGNPPKKHKPAVSSDNSGGLFSDPIRVSQVSQQAVSKQTSNKASHTQSPQPSVGSGIQQIIEGLVCISV